MRLQGKAIFFLLFVLLLFISLNRHSRHPDFDYHSQLFTDKSGYQVYLPAFFYFDMDGSKMPKDIDKKIGQGFKIVDNKIITKYPIGVAIVQAPFFAVAGLYDDLMGITVNKGFTSAQHLALNWSTAIYGVFGLILVFLTGVKYWNMRRSFAYFLVLALLFCSNLMYYMTRDCGMSHTYSFTVFAGLQYLLFRMFSAERVGWKSIIIVLLLLSMVVALRPLNLLFILFPLSYIVLKHREIIKQIEWDRGVLGLIIGILLACIPIVLQLMYNRYAFDSFFADSYEGESFSRWASLDLLTFWFAPNNGVFLYIPILLVPLIWIYKSVRKGEYLSLLFLVYMLAISITYAAWWSPTLGCGFGHRGFTEHLVFYALPMASYMGTLKPAIIKRGWVLALFISAFLFVTQWNFDGCWYGEGAWDWSEFWTLVYR